MSLRAPYALLGVLGRARLADDRHLDLARVGQAVLDLLDDVAREARGREVVDFVRADEDADLAAGLHALMSSATWTIGASMQAYSTSWWCAAMLLTTLNGMLCFWAIDAPMAACGPSTSWSTALPMS